MSISLPEGWVEAPLADVGIWGSGGTPLKGFPGFYEGDIPWAKIGDLQDNLLTKTESLISHSGLQNSSAKWIPPSSLLIAMYGSIGKLAVTGIRCASNQAIAYCFPHKNVADVWFLFWLLKSKRRELQILGQGGTQQNISQTILKAFQIQLPPLPEQRRIVARIEALFTHVHRIRTDLERVLTLAKRHRKREVDSIFEDGLLAKWPENTFGELTVEIRNGISTKPADEPPGIPILRISAVRHSRVLLSDHRFHRLPPVSSFFLKDRDLLFIRFNGNPEFVASCGMIRKINGPTLYPDKLIRVRLNEQIALPEFIEIAMSSSMVRSQLTEHIKTAAGQHGISGTDLWSGRAGETWS